MLCPYAHPEYAQSLAEFGSLRRLAASGGWLLERTIPGTPGWRDAVGCYPLFVCRDPAGLAADLDELRAGGLVSVVVVADPLTGGAGDAPERWFDAVARPWKDHYLVDLARPLEQTASAHHRRNARRFARHAAVDVVADPPAVLDDWCRLYDALVARHDITGPARFSRTAFARQLTVPGTVVVSATAAGDDAPCGMQIWYTDGRHAWHHLSGYDPTGYRWGGASYALAAAALAHLRAQGVGEVDLGSGAGLAHDPADGLSRFKAGWSTHTRPAWLLGAVLDPDRHAALCAGRAGTYFPLYRDPAAVPTGEVLHAGQD